MPEPTPARDILVVYPIRLSSQDIRNLRAQADHQGKQPTALARQMIVNALAMGTHEDIARRINVLLNVAQARC